MKEKRRLSTTLRVESLETREMLSTSPAAPGVVASETFAQTTVGELPAGWAQWDSQGTIQTLPGRARNGGTGLVASGSSGETARAWLSAVQPANVQINSTFRLDSLIPTEFLLRGKKLDTTSPTYYALTLARGLDLELWRVTDGNRTYLGSVHSSDYLSGASVRVAFQADGDNLRASVYRLDTRLYLNASGQWQTMSTWALERRDSAITGSGAVGLGRQSGYAGDTVFDDFQATRLVKGSPVRTPAYSQQFSQTVAGRLPPGWVQWSNQAPAAVILNPGASYSKALRFDAGSGNNARAWLSDTLPADLEASASVLVDNLVPSELIVRGHGLDSATPTYYAATLTRGLHVQLWKVVNGVRTKLGELKSTEYMSGRWLRVSLDAEGSTLRVRVQRLDTGEFLGPSGNWQRAETWSLTRSDSAIAGPGKVGLGREASYDGQSTFDDLLAAVPNTPPPNATLSGLVDGAVLSSSVLVEAKVDAAANARRVEFLVDERRESVDTRGPFQWLLNPGSFAAGPHQLTVRVTDTRGNTTELERDFTVTRTPPPSDNGKSPAAPNIPQHYDYIRLAELAYNGLTFGPLEQQLLRNSIDLVIPDTSNLVRVNHSAPNTPQLVYTNASNLYQDTLLDWLAYADAHGINRESAFYHVAHALAFAGNSASSQPVNWFWGVYLDGTPRGLLDLTSNAHTASDTLTLGERGQSLYIGYTEQFREINVNLASGARGGWSGVLEYATSVDSQGQPTGWAPLKTLSDSTKGFRHSGQITFDPPKDWKTSLVGNGGSRLFHVRIRTVTSGTAPVARTILGRDYVNAHGGKTGIIPAFDASADLNHDGYLNDMEYAHRAPGMNARFAYESRVFFGTYGQMRPATNPSSAAFRAWLIDYHERFLRTHSLADGFFIDNSGGKVPVADSEVLENTANYTTDYATMLRGLESALAPRWTLVNTSNGNSKTNAIVGGTSAYFEEFALRPLTHTYQQFEDLANAIAQRQGTNGSRTPFAVLDSLPTGGSPTDPRTHMATLAYYYLLADPKHTFLDLYGGYEPSTQWSRHWIPAIATNVGQPKGDWKLFSTGRDPSNKNLTYRVYERDYTNAIVLYKPLSYSPSKGVKGTLGANTATTQQLNGRYRPLRANGILGAPVTSISLRNGEGAILIRA
jgi:hypothetical protein